MAKKGKFSRGNISRAHRDVIACELEAKGVPNPYAVATSLVKKGARSDKTKEVSKEFKEQKRMTLSTQIERLAINGNTVLNGRHTGSLNAKSDA